jgi:phosphatidylinositol alpha 1,6-mannosyltransferase
VISPLRVALFTDSLLEANGVGTVSQRFLSFAGSHNLPFFCAFGGKQTRIRQERSVTICELKRGLASFSLDHELRCDPLLVRFKNRVTRATRAFRPDLIQITGPGDLGVLGFWVAHSLQVPLAASWHTNLHEYAALRLERALGCIPSGLRRKGADLARKWSLDALTRFYRLGRFLLAPNEAARSMLAERTGRSVFGLGHGVDCEMFSPARRRRKDDMFTIGYAGRLTPEKGVRMFAEIERRIEARGHSRFRLVLLGEGSERGWLHKHLKRAEFAGVLRGDALAHAFADMDAFVFPSATDTFGLVLLEAMASGVPVLASAPACGRIGVRDGVEGFAASSAEEFAQGLERLMNDDWLRGRMGNAARDCARRQSWNRVFETLYETYDAALDREVREAQPA